MTVILFIYLRAVQIMNCRPRPFGAGGKAGLSYVSVLHAPQCVHILIEIKFRFLETRKICCNKQTNSMV
jgi:hypothetical protein